MATGVTRLTDVIVPAVFSPYVQNLTEVKSRIVQSGAMVADASMANLLSGGGLTFSAPSWRDLDNDAENVSTDDPTQFSVPNKIGTLAELQVRLSRNNSWSSMDLTADLVGSDPMNAIANRVSAYWGRRLQLAFIATMQGVFADNLANDAGDMSFNISGVSFTDGTTNFSAEAYIDAQATMGDTQDALSMVLTHSIVYNRMRKNNLIDFIPDSTNSAAAAVPTFMGARVVVDDGMVRTLGVFETWMFGAGAVRWGNGTPKVPTETKREPSAGLGGGQDILFNRVEWMIHPVGFAYTGTPPAGGPSNAATTNNLAIATSWNRVFPERKQVKIARLITREY